MKNKKKQKRSENIACTTAFPPLTLNKRNTSTIAKPKIDYPKVRPSSKPQKSNSTTLAHTHPTSTTLAKHSKIPRINKPKVSFFTKPQELNPTHLPSKLPNSPILTQDSKIPKIDEVIVFILEQKCCRNYYLP